MYAEQLEKIVNALNDELVKSFDLILNKYFKENNIELSLKLFIDIYLNMAGAFTKSMLMSCWDLFKDLPVDQKRRTFDAYVRIITDRINEKIGH